MERTMERTMETTVQTTMDIQLPAGLTGRPATIDDLDGVVALMQAHDVFEIGEPDTLREDVLSEWQRTRFDLATDAMVVENAPGEIIGYVEAWEKEPHVRISSVGTVHPDHFGRGIGNALMQWSEARARAHIPFAPAGAQVTNSHITSHKNTAARALFESHGYHPVRSFWRMEIDLTQPPAGPQWPEGITVRAMDPVTEAHATYEAVEEAFADHWGHVRGTFDDWATHAMARDDFDANLFFLAMDGDAVAGTSLCYHWPNLGWVRHLAVRKPWRRQGLGIALLLYSFGEFYRRGERKVGLGVDSQNATGATRLYERAGMHVAQQFDFFEKVLR